MKRIYSIPTGIYFGVEIVTKLESIHGFEILKLKLAVLIDGVRVPAAPDIYTV